MPPTSVSIFEEGAEIVSFKIVKDGVFDRDGLVEYLIDKPSQYPGSSGCRNIKDVESDLKAVSCPLLYFDPAHFHVSQQIAANHKGIQLIQASASDIGSFSMAKRDVPPISC
jgi:5-oxoprolinase (ATP-hydrolysing)